MKKTIYFHIGTHKTGSTALQIFFKNNFSNWDSDIVYYPCTNGINHIELSHDLNLWKDVELDKSKNYIFSSEDFFSVFNSDEEPSLIKIINQNEWIRNDFNIKVILYLREPLEYFESVYNELIKRHHYFKSPTSEIVDLDYYSRVKLIETCIGRDEIVIRQYLKSEFYEGDICKDFLHAIGINNFESYKININYINKALPLNALTFMRYVNACDLPNEIISELQRKMISAFAKENCAKENNNCQVIPYEVKKDLLMKFGDGYEKLKLKYFDGAEFVRHKLDVEQDFTINNDMYSIRYVIDIFVENDKVNVLRDVFNYISNHPSNKEERLNYQCKLHSILKGALNVSELTYIEKSFEFYSIYSQFPGASLPADFLRDLSDIFYKDGDLDCAYATLKKAVKLRPEGGLIKKKIKEIESLLNKVDNQANAKIY